MDRTGLRDGDVVAIKATPEAKNGDVVVARFGDEVTLKRFVRLNARYVELRPDSRNAEHQPIKIDLAKYILNIDGVAVGRSSGGWAVQANEGTPANGALIGLTRRASL